MPNNNLKGINNNPYKEREGLLITDKQLSVFRMVSEGFNTKEISTWQGVMEGAVYSCVERFVRKNNFKTTYQAIYALTKKGII